MKDLRDDEDLVRTFQSGPESEAGRRAVSELLKRWRARIHAWCWHVVRERELAEDLAQDCLVLIHRALPGFEPRAKVSSWMFAVVRNRCLSELRKRRPARVEWDEAEEIADAAEEPAERFERRAGEDEVLTIMRDTLTPDEQTALWLRAYEDMNVDDITRLLGVTGSTGARGLLQTARRKLRAALAARGRSDA
jgi:RNA polymerase sigma-70 factor (ECF subfamily)